MMKSYYRIILGRKNTYAQECIRDGFMGGAGINEDLSASLSEKWQDFNKKFIPVYVLNNPEKTKIGAGLVCGFLWTICKGIQKGDMIISPDGNGNYRMGEVTGNYYYCPNQNLPHRRKVQWFETPFPKSGFSKEFLNSAGSIGTVCNVSGYGAELERLASGISPVAPIISTDPTIDDPLEFAMEKHLEEFLVRNWSQTLLGTDFEVYEEDGEPVGQQYSTEAGPIDVLAISKDKKRLLVVELKKGRASDVVVGQILRYMGFVKEQIAETNQTVEGAIIALEDDSKLRWALLSVPTIRFYKYQISFKLLQG